MGAWGNGIEESDTVLDVVDAFAEHLRHSQNAAVASDQVRQAFEHLLGSESDVDGRAHVRIGLALVQWRYGVLEPSVLDEVRADLAARHGIDSYREPAKREKVLRSFVAKLAKPNPKPRAFPKPSKGAPKQKQAAFDAGDCLALQLPSGAYRAALVLVRDRCTASEEFNVVALLDWQGDRPPHAELFASARLRRIAMHPHGPYKGRASVAIVGRIDVDPARLGIEKMPDYWSWQLVRPGGQRQPMGWFGWDDLAGVLP